MGQAYTVWVKIREHNEVLDTFVGALAVRRSLPRRIEEGLELSIATEHEPPAIVPQHMEDGVVVQKTAPVRTFIPQRSGGWMGNRQNSWMRGR